MKNRIDPDEIKTFVDQYSTDTKLYIGCDSLKFKRNGVWYAEYALVAVVHINGCNGCRVFAEIQVEKDYDPAKNKPRMRLMNEVYKTAELYLRLAEVLPDVEIECHLDINPDKKHNSSIVVNEAIGYIRGVCGVTPKVKNESWAATHCSDHILRHRNEFKVKRFWENDNSPQEKSLIA